MSDLTNDHKNLFNSWNALREHADGQVAEVSELKSALEEQLQAKISACNAEAKTYMPILRAIEQKKANVEAEMHGSELPFPNMTVTTEDLTTAASNFLNDGTTDPITVNYTTSEEITPEQA